jgi:hypothetical protein
MTFGYLPGIGLKLLSIRLANPVRKSAEGGQSDLPPTLLAAFSNGVNFSDANPYTNQQPFCKQKSLN